MRAIRGVQEKNDEIIRWYIEEFFIAEQRSSAKYIVNLEVKLQRA